MVNWDDYRVFLEVARCGGLSAASQRLKMDPATVGRRIQRLEKTLRVLLFVKLSRGYELTSAGSDILTHIEKIESVEKTVRGGVKNDPSNLSGTIRIGATDGLANYVLPQVCVKIGKIYPNLNIQILSLPRVFNLSKREADIAIMPTPPKTGKLLVQKITDYKLHLVGHKDYLQKSAPILNKSDLKQHRIIGYISDLIFDTSIDYNAEISPNRPPNLSSNSVSVQIQMVKNAAGLCIMHDFTLPYFTEFKRILMEQISLTRSFYLVRHKDDKSNERLNLIAGILLRDIKKEIQHLENTI